MKKQHSRKGQRLFALLFAMVMVFTAMPMNAIALTASSVNEDGYIEVYTIEDLYNIRNDLTANYILMNDIDLTEATKEGGDWDSDGCGWMPIGSGVGSFSGDFDGNNKKIIGLTLQRSDAGLFQSISGNIHDLTMIDNKVSGSSNVGAFAASANGATFTNCVAYGQINGSAGKTSSKIHTGGFVGTGTNTNFVRCVNYATVLGGTYTGGFLGSLSGISKMEYCFNAGAVTSDYDCGYAYDYTSTPGFKYKDYHYNYAGGFTAQASGDVSIVNSYNCGSVSVFTPKKSETSTTIYYYYGYAAGAVASGSSSVQYCYNVGTVSAYTAEYSLAPSGVKDSFFLSGTATANGSTSLTESQMKIQSMYKGFDFENVWLLNTYANHPYPQLRNNIQDLSESAELVSILTPPVKTEYYTGDTLDFTGSMVKVVYVSGREEIVAITEEMVSGFDMSLSGTQDVVVTVAGASDYYTVQVAQRPVVSAVSIVLEPDTKVFAVGTAFDFRGAQAKISYVGGAVEYKEIPVEATTGGNINHVGKQTITYSFGGKSASFEVEVVGVALEKIVLTALPDRLTYLEGQELDLTGLLVTAVMNNGLENVVRAGYTVSGYSSEPGDYTITVTYLEKTASFQVSVAARKLVSLELNTLPDRLEYVSGQSFDETGMQVIASYDNGDVEVAENYTVSGFDSTPGIKTVVVSLEGQSVSFPAKVVARVITEFRLVSEPSKREYIEYDAFDPTGLKVEATYNDGITKTITDYELSGFSSKPGTHTVTVAYEGFVKSFEINVTPRVLVDVKVKAPNKITYDIGEEFDGEGMTVTACYNNGQEIVVDDYQLVGFDSNSAGAKTITITYGGISRSFAVAVQERSAIEAGGNMIVGNLIGRLGETVVIPVNVTKNTGIAGFTHTINFDTTALKLISVDAVGGYADGTIILNDEKIANGIITVLWFGSADVEGDGAVYNLTFEILETAQDGNAEIVISFEDNDHGNVSGENVIFGKINGFVEVRSYWLGDLNGDREYHMVDLLRLAQYVSGQEMTLNEKQLLSADVNEDAVIDIHDVIMLQQWIITAGVPEA